MFAFRGGGGGDNVLGGTTCLALQKHASSSIDAPVGAKLPSLGGTPPDVLYLYAISLWYGTRERDSLKLKQFSDLTFKLLPLS